MTSHLLFDAKTAPSCSVRIIDKECTIGCRNFSRAVTVLTCKETLSYVRYSARQGLQLCESASHMSTYRLVTQ